MTSSPPHPRTEVTGQKNPRDSRKSFIQCRSNQGAGGKLRPFNCATEREGEQASLETGARQVCGGSRRESRTAIYLLSETVQKASVEKKQKQQQVLGNKHETENERRGRLSSVCLTSTRS